MSSTWKNNIELTIFGESHGPVVGITLGNLPSGIVLDENLIRMEMQRRRPGYDRNTTPRKESDQVDIVSGVLDGVTTGAPLTAIIKNENIDSNAYLSLATTMRPGHSDYPAHVKYQGYNDIRGGGHFSGRLTAPLVFAGAIAKQILASHSIVIGAHIKQMHQICDSSFASDVSNETLQSLHKQTYPVLDPTIIPNLLQCVQDAKEQGESVGGRIECAICGVPAGLGDPFFSSIESQLSSLLFSVPAVKSVSFGNEKISELYGSQANDSYYYDVNKQVKTRSNHNGGIIGGISTGMPIVFTVGIKPTASIAKRQQTIHITECENTEIALRGRHDPCIVIRAIAVIEAMAAITMLDFMRYI